MREHAERLSQPPLREGVCRITLVVNRKGGFKPFVHQVRVKFGHLLGEHHAFVDDRTARQRRQIKLRNARCGRRFFDATADHVQFALESFFVDAFGIADQNLFNLWAGRIGFFPQTFNLYRHVAPAINVVAHAQNFGLDDGPARFLRAEICAWQKHLTNRDQLVHVRGVTGAFDLVVKEFHRDLNVDARAIPRLAICIDSAAVPDCF